jgi:mono/diheme cytochrome c family protein
MVNYFFFMRHPISLILLLLAIFVSIMGCTSSAVDDRAAAAVDPQQQRGEIVFKQNCATCHAVTPNTIVIGPTLAGIAERGATRVEGLDARQYIEMTILNPGSFLVEGYPDVMPTNFGKRLSGEEFDALVAYLLSLK